jgi:hypothetical protein
MYAIPVLALVTLTGVVVYQMSQPKPIQPPQNESRKRMGKAAAEAVWVDTPVNTVLRDDAQGESLEVIEQKVRDTYAHEARHHHGVRNVDKSVAK